MRWIAPLLVAMVATPALAQSSTSYKLEEHTFNSGGRPSAGQVADSASYRISLDALGGLAAQGLTGTSYRMDVGLVPTYGPPGEVAWLTFTDQQTLEWPGLASAAHYNLYRDTVSNLSGLGFGACSQPSIATSFATDGTIPSIGDGYFYLVTAVNRLAEEGGKGARSNGTERGGSTCP